MPDLTRTPACWLRGVKSHVAIAPTLQARRFSLKTQTGGVPTLKRPVRVQSGMPQLLTIGEIGVLLFSLPHIFLCGLGAPVGYALQLALADVPRRTLDAEQKLLR